MHRNGKLHIFNSNHRAVTTAATTTAEDGNLRVSQKEFKIHIFKWESFFRSYRCHRCFHDSNLCEKTENLSIGVRIEMRVHFIYAATGFVPCVGIQEKKNIPSGILQLKICLAIEL